VVCGHVVMRIIPLQHRGPLNEAVCENPHKVKVSGLVQDVDGKHRLTVAKFSVKD